MDASGVLVLFLLVASLVKKDPVSLFFRPTDNVKSTKKSEAEESEDEIGGFLFLSSIAPHKKAPVC